MNREVPDYLGSKAASEMLAQRMRHWWRKRGFLPIINVVEEKGPGEAKIWVIRFATPIYATDVRKEWSVL